MTISKIINSKWSTQNDDPNGFIVKGRYVMRKDYLDSGKGIHLQYLGVSPQTIESSLADSM